MVAMRADRIIEPPDQRTPDRTNPVSRPIALTIALFEVTRRLPFKPLMKTKSIRLACLLATLFALPTVARAQGSAFTYQGRLTENGSPTSSTNDFTFTLYNAASGGATVGVSNVINNLVLSNGLFTVTLDFGAAAFPGNDRWLDIAVRPGTSSGAYTALTPRQPIASTPYALRAANLTGTLPQSQLPTGVVTNNRTGVTLSGTFTGNGAALSSLSAASLTGTILDARLSPNVALRGGGNAFTGNQTITGGNVGIGTTTPSATLDVAGTIRADYLAVDPQDGATEGGELVLRGAAAFPDWAMDVAGSYLRFHTGGLTKLQMDPAAGMTVLGNVGIGIAASPSATLDVAGAIRGDYLVLDAVDGGTEGGEILLRGAAAYPDWGMDVSGSTLRFHSLGGVKLQLDPAAGVTAYGDLSFGDGASTIQFPAVSGASSPMINMFASGFANANRMVLAHSPSFANWGLQYQDVTDQFDFLAGGSPVMTVALGSRNVGVGTASPQGQFHVYSPYNPTVVRVQSAGAPGFGRIEFVSNPQGDVNEWRPAYIQSLDAGGFTGGLGFYVNGTGAGNKFASVEAMRLFASGLYVNGNVDYTGQLNKFDVAENFTATVRAADFLFGHSARRGAPGRALVDLTDTLYLNFANDWAHTFIGGDNVSVCTLTIRGGCDIAEPFQMTSKEIPKGAVVVIDEDNAGHLKMSDQACDRRVAGIISGANGVNTGVTLTQEGVFEGGQNVALSGRVYVQADASNGSIKPGDLLTTSDVPGHAMKVTDHSKAQGAILGKAMTALKDGRGMVLVLVTLQ